MASKGKFERGTDKIPVTRSFSHDWKPEATRPSAVSGARKMLPDVVQRTAF